MYLMRPYTEILYMNEAYESMLLKVELAGKTCYKSQTYNCSSDRESFIIEKLIKQGHDSVLEHVIITVKFVCDRGVSHEIVRHRIASYSQESTRYCNYSKHGVCFIIPPWVTDIQEGEYSNSNCMDMDFTDRKSSIWFFSMDEAEKDYLSLLSLGWTPQQARSVLPNSLKTAIIVTMNIREWRHFFKLRAIGVSGKPHPQMLEITNPLFDKFKTNYPAFFQDLKKDVENG